jgi:hypothetical protein
LAGADAPIGLRCGDLNAANSVLRQYANSGGGGDDDPSVVGPDVVDVVAQLAALQRTGETIFGGDASLLSPAQSMVQCRRRVADAYERTKTRSSSSRDAGRPHAHFRAACLAMLGGSESISEAPTLEASGLVTTVEDYLYASLWHALHLAEALPPPPSVASSAGAVPDGGGLRGVAEAVARLASLVKDWGPTYFEQDESDGAPSYVSASGAVALAAGGGGGGGGGGAVWGGAGASGGSPRVPRSGGWAYALPLLASQQYETALAYLAEAGGGLGLLQATHVGIAMDAAGLSLGDFASGEGQSCDSSSSSRETILPILVASYSASLQELDAGAALKYLVLLTGRGKFVKEQVRILSPYDWSGKIAKDGVTSNSNHCYVFCVT